MVIRRLVTLMAAAGLVASVGVVGQSAAQAAPGNIAAQGSSENDPLVQSGSLSGYVRQNTGTGLGATVSRLSSAELRDSNGRLIESVTLDDLGRFSFTGLAPGAYEVTAVVNRGIAQKVQTFVLQERENKKVEILVDTRPGTPGNAVARFNDGYLRVTYDEPSSAMPIVGYSCKINNEPMLILGPNERTCGYGSSSYWPGVYTFSVRAFTAEGSSAVPAVARVDIPNGWPTPSRPEPVRPKSQPVVKCWNKGRVIRETRANLREAVTVGNTPATVVYVQKRVSVGRHKEWRIVSRVKVVNHRAVVSLAKRKGVNVYRLVVPGTALSTSYVSSPLLLRR